MITDVFLFNDEFDILDCRLYELRGVVDRFVAIEGDLTLAGDERPLRLSDRRMDYPDVEILEVSLRDISGVPPQRQGYVASGYEDFWARDWKQRQVGDDFMGALPASALVMYGDVDEIPRRETVQSFDRPEAHRMMMDLLIYSTRWSAGRAAWTGTVIGPRVTVPAYTQIHTARKHLPMLHDAGWHMTWFGGEEACVNKAKMFAHGEIGADLDRVRDLYRGRLQPGSASPLGAHEGDLPTWVMDGRAPASWTES